MEIINKEQQLIEDYYRKIAMEIFTYESYRKREFDYMDIINSMMDFLKSEAAKAYHEKLSKSKCCGICIEGLDECVFDNKQELKQSRVERSDLRLEFREWYINNKDVLTTCSTIFNWFAPHLKSTDNVVSFNSFDSIRYSNITRQLEWNNGSEKLSLAYKGNELAGEVGELCNVLKKLERERIGIKGSKATKTDAEDEIADVIICADLIAEDLGINLFEAVKNKFNKTSIKYEFKTMFINLQQQQKQSNWDELRKEFNLIFISSETVNPKRLKDAFDWFVKHLQKTSDSDAVKFAEWIYRNCTIKKDDIAIAHSSIIDVPEKLKYLYIKFSDRNYCDCGYMANNNGVCTDCGLQKAPSQIPKK